MITIEDFITRTNSAGSSEQVFSIFREALCSYGFDRVVYSLITDHASLGKKAGHGVAGNYPQDWMAYYAEKGYQNVDPVPRYAFSTDRPFTWDWVKTSLELQPDEMKVMNQAEDAGLLDGVGIPIYGINGEIAGIGLASSTGGIRPDKNMLCILRTLAMQFHLAFSEHEATESEIRKVSLTGREKEILLWAAEGKSDPSIAEILGISVPTVRYHLNNIYKKLDANERTFAVVKALRHGLITPNFVTSAPYHT